MALIEKLIVTHRGALKRKYGSRTAEIDQALARLVARDKARDLTTKLIALDDPAALARAGGAPVVRASDDRAAKRAIDALMAHHRPEYLMILGSVDVVPHVSLQNPAFGDEDDDDDVPSDLPYACDAPYSRDPRKYTSPTRVIGRLPDLTGPKGASGLDPTYLVRQLDRAINWRSRPRAEFAEHFGVSAYKWRRSTALSLENLYGNAAELHLSPDEGPKWSKALLGRRVHFINCHGGRRDWRFYGEHRGKFPEAHDSTHLDAKRAITEGAVVAAECCYGAQLYDPSKTEPRGIASAYMDLGAYAFFGSTTIAYGPFSGNGYADLICQYFIERVLRGASSGRAVLEAQQRFLQASGALDETELKTIAQFILLGDPSVHPVARAPHALEESKAFATAFQRPGAKRAQRVGRRFWLLRGAEMITRGVGSVGRRERFSANAQTRKVLLATAREESLRNLKLYSHRMRDPLGKRFAREFGVSEKVSVHVVSGQRSARPRKDGRIDYVKIVALVRGHEIVSLRKLEAR